MRTNPDIRLISHRHTLGCGAARVAGTRAARGRVIAWTDCDMTYPNDSIADLVAELHRQGVHQVIGARLTETGTHAKLRAHVKDAIRRYAERSVNQHIPDLNSGMRVFLAETCHEAIPLMPTGFSCASTMTLSYLRVGRAVAFVPIYYSPRQGRSKFKPVRDTWRLVRQVHRLASRRPHTFVDPEPCKMDAMT